MGLLTELVARGFERGRLKEYSDWKRLLQSSLTVREATLLAGVKEFSYEEKAIKLATFVKNVIKIRILALREIHGPNELTDEMYDDIFKDLEDEIVTLASLLALLGWKEKEIHDFLMLFLNLDKKDF